MLDTKTQGHNEKQTPKLMNSHGCELDAIKIALHKLSWNL